MSRFQHEEQTKQSDAGALDALSAGYLQRERHGACRGGAALPPQVRTATPLVIKDSSKGPASDC